MELSSLHAQLRARQLQDFYIFTGPEWAVQKIYIEQIAKISGNETFRVDEFSEIYGKLKSKGFLSKNYVYIIRDDKDIMNNEKVQRQIKDGLLGKNILVYLITNPDKRTKFWKAYKDTIVEFEPLKPAILKKYIQREINLSDKNLNKLMEVCEYDYGRCLLEIDKVNEYVNYLGHAKTHDGAFQKLLADGTIYTPPKDAIFDFVDAILDRKVNLSYNLFEQCKAVGEATMVMLSVLYNNAKAVLQVQSCESKDISKSTGLTGWQIQNAKKHLHKYSNGDLVYMLKLIHKCEKGIKTGKIDEKYVMDYVLGEVL